MQMEIIGVALVILLGSFTQGLTGFGLALVSVPLLSLLIDVKTAIPLAGIFGWLVTFPIVIKMHRHIQWKMAIALFLGSIPGSFMGADLLKRLPAPYILVSMGFVLVISSLYSFFANKQLKKSSPAYLALGTGFLSGALGASVGEPGPPTIAFLSLQPWRSDETKSTLVFFFMLQMIGALLGFWHKNLLTEQVFSYVYSSLLTFFLGLSLGMFAYQLLNKYQINYHKIIHSMLLIIGFALILKNITKL